MKIDRKNIPFELKTVEESQDGAICTFSGLGAAFFNLDWTGDIIDPGAFVQDIEFMRKSGVLRDEHYVTTGRIVGGEEITQGLSVTNAIYATSAGKDQAILVKARAITKMSIGYSCLAREWLETPEAVKAYWQSKGYTPTEDDLIALGCFGYARLLKRVKVYEVSTTWSPANDKAEITDVKSAQRRGRTFGDHTTQVLETVGEFVERAEKVAKLRAEKGRGISADHKARLGSLTGRLQGLLSTLEAKGQATEEETQTQTGAPDDNALFSSFQAVLARVNGLNV